ncbi:hypothetical protein F5876DRAFT_67202 [Lentinula aff. lateritia]|uniref:Uncharacterized protein n=1 Tax=Lentinula aff. lateritia TaxID=2804960 RepID=A0ACC1TUU6_9AGAR|nr:hypothetical protein F5876DRAFT_67202 [Lentinula aff. lateritia]
MSYEIVDITVGNSTETVSINKSLWVRDNNPRWGALIEGYFGQRSTLDSLKASDQPILEIPIAQEFDLTQKILIRSELQTMYKRVGALYRSNLRSGAIITGQPGCGKSTSIPYFLVEQLADKRPVYVMDKIEQVYFITNMASFSLPLILESICPQLQPLSQEVEEQEELFQDALYYCVPTPRALRLFLEPLLLKKQLEEQNLEPEQDSEQTPLVHEVQPLESGQMDRLGIEQTSVNSQGMFNPANRDYVRAVAHAIERLNTLQDLAKFLEIRAEAGYAGEISYQLLCIYRSESRGSPSNRHVKIASDTAYVDFASPWIGEELLRRHSEWQTSDLCEFYHKISERSDLAVAAGVMFNFLFVKRIITPSLTNLRFGLYSALNTLPKPQTRKRAKIPHIRFISSTLAPPYSKSALHCSNSEVDEVDKLDPPDGDDTREDDGDTDNSNTSSIPQPRWNGAFSLNRYHMIQEVEPVLCTLHVPYKRNNPLFDALLLQEDSPSCVTLWVIQVTAAKKHGGASARYNNVKDIYNKSVEKYGDGNVRVGYMLLVPPKYHQVEWTFEDIHLLPENLRPSNGNVYV